MAFKAVSEAKVFTWLMGKFTEPDEIFGPVDLLSLKEGKRRRVTQGKLPEAHAAFLDEFWKASTAIANTLLRIVNERVFDNGGGDEKVPLRCLVAASNEYPQDGELGAMFDRFVLRREVTYVGSRQERKQLLQTPDHTPKNLPALTLQELDRASADASNLPVSDAVWAKVLEIVEKLIDAGIRPSDRRLCQVQSVVKAYAYVMGASKVETWHLHVLRYMLWDVPGENRRKCEQIVDAVACSPLMRMTSLLGQANSVADAVYKADVGAAGQKEKACAAAIAKLDEIHKELMTLEIPKRDDALVLVQGLKKDVQMFLIGANSLSSTSYGDPF